MVKAFFLFVFLIVAQIGIAQEDAIVFKSETLQVVKLHDNVFQHISYLETKTYGKVSCNGMVVVSNGEAVVIDTPSTEKATIELMSWLKSALKTEIAAVIPSHFHSDCLGTLKTFHEYGADSYAYKKTLSLAASKGETVPNHGFENHFEFTVGNEKIVCTYHGPGHTEDNIVVYVPKAKVLFGGCLVKSLGAGKGNLEDANVALWSETVQNVKKDYQENDIIVIPGHGAKGGMDLLDYTITMFQ